MCKIVLTTRDTTDVTTPCIQCAHITVSSHLKASALEVSIGLCERVSEHTSGRLVHCGSRSGVAETGHAWTVALRTGLVSNALHGLDRCVDIVR